jgi:hypothetical protein
MSRNNNNGSGEEKNEKTRMGEGVDGWSVFKGI